MRVGVTALRGRRPEITYLYEDDDDPTKLTGALSGQLFTGVDLAMFRALAAYEATLCPGCGHPKALAWHSGTAGQWTAQEAVCHVCTLQQGDEVPYTDVTSTLTPEQERLLPEWAWGQTTTTPRPRPSH